MVGGAIASESSLASKIGGEILEKGGSAADAMIATVLAVHVGAAYHSDIGGSGFALIRTSKGEYEALNFRMIAPMGASMDLYKAGASTSIGGMAVGVPGEIKGLEMLHRKYGKLPWKDLIEPSIRLSEEGFLMTNSLRFWIMMDCDPPRSETRGNSWMAQDSNYDIYFDPNGRVLPVGSKLYRKEYARTLRLIAEQGSEVFYNGEVGEAIVKAVKDRGGVMSLEDLKGYNAKWSDVIQGRYRGHTLSTVPAPASGAIFRLALEIVDQLGEPPQVGSAEDYHRISEALRWAYSHRAQLGDPDRVESVSDLQSKWARKEYITSIANKISDDQTFPRDHYNPNGVEIKEDHGTSHIVTADSTGLTISLTTTVGLNFGSRITVPGYGFVLNDSMDDFSVEGQSNYFGYAPSEANYVAPGKRPLSSSCPYMIENENGEMILAGGAAGGSRIISSNVQVARGVLDHDLSAKEALAFPRLHNQLIPNITELESGMNGIVSIRPDVAEQLEKKGHEIKWFPRAMSTACAIKWLPEGKGWEAVGEPRSGDSGGWTSTST